MPDYVIKGRISDTAGKSLAGIIYVQAVDSDQQLYEDHDDDIIATVRAKSDGSFEIPFDKESFQDNWLEGNPDLYLVIRKESGQVIHKTEIRKGVQPGDSARLMFEVVLESLEKPVTPDPHPYDQNINRVIAAFASLGDTIELRTEDTMRNLALFSSSIDGWTHYTNELAWKSIGYDGPQVPRYSWKQNHVHKLAWEKDNGGSSIQ
jgi:hypothetical protein